jgi:hypothetical protein
VNTSKYSQIELGIALCALVANTSAASPIWVSNTNDAGDYSLRAAIRQVNEAGGGEIRFSITNTISLLSPLPSLTNITITGPGTNLLTISGNSQVQVFCMNSGTTNTLSGLTIADGTMLEYSSFAVGGAGISNAGCLTLLSCAISNCTSGNLGGGEQVGGGIYNSGNLLMQFCEVADCAVFLYSRDEPPGYGGGIANNGVLRMEDCTVSDCYAVAAYGGGGGGIASFENANLYLTNCLITSCTTGPQGDGGGILGMGTLTIASCTVSNCDGFWGGGIESWGNCAITNSTIVHNGARLGGGLFLEGTNELVSCTISGNSAAPGPGGGVFNYGGYLSMFNCTISENGCHYRSGSGIGNGDDWGYGHTNATIYMDHCTVVNYDNWPGSSGVDNVGAFYSQDSIFAGNGSTDFAGVLTSQGYNLIQNTNDCVIVGDPIGNLLGVGPLLGSLQDNGGPTRTHALLTGSPAIDAGSSMGNLAVDQRGVHRPQGLAPDIGAFEFQYATPLLVRMAVESCTNCSLKLCGLSGESYILQASTNLVNWINVATNMADTNGVCDFTERGTGKCSRCFYRPLALGH